ncbi:MAG TPA: dihydroorotase [Chitinophagales bacterium]|nr:dihydroorotase [Chitinophagales bacterium]HMW12159.1 dihydroorotase [Chitinophagales bacterium]HMX59310.1 dihydroorotase [Chitinophagales bacterium]HMY24142.1 dihydroorotase [Chitinophagales bacterium]HMZ32506.1 dihydroorotase [Chitinophagales bacterium]
MKYLIKNGHVVNEGKIKQKDILIVDEYISKIDTDISDETAIVIDASNQYIIPGIIDDQVHFREPGLTHKATIYSESKAAIAGGVTSFMEQPNTKPAALTQNLLEEKYQIAAQTSLANYTFFMGTSNDNYDEVMRTDFSKIGALKIFMGSSTGNMLVDDEHILNKIFANIGGIVVTHCEDEQTILQHTEKFKSLYNENIPMNFHPIIRSDEACYLSSKLAIDLAKKHQTRLHIFHVSTAKELDLFSNQQALKDKKITAEVCVHHLYFDERDYAALGSKIKCNPAIKFESDKRALLQALLDDKLDVIATDHAPHTLQEKNNPYLTAPSGLPLVQHSLNMMLDFYHQQKISLEKIIEKMCHAPAECFKIKNRGYLREGYYADIAIVDIHQRWSISTENILYKCAWSPLENISVYGKINQTFVNGHLVYNKGIFDESKKGHRLLFSV